ncbi:MAG: thiol-disulfide isomerase [Pirellulaceae bacterium]|nr:MAG: thiol-disulfide isomerase [Pirellulaceae bacterium]
MSRYLARKTTAGWCRWCLVLCAWWVATRCGSPAFCQQADEVGIGKRLDGFALRDYRGKLYTLDDFRDYPVLVIAFVGVECPLAKLYAARLSQLESQYRDRGVAFVGVDANVQDSLAELAAFARRQQIEFPLLKDADQELADRLGAERTPEVFLLDKERRVRYRGRIDDQYGISVVRARPEKPLLQQAIEEVLQGKPVSVPYDPAVGCIIGRHRRPDESSPVTYSRQIARILQKHCISCHRPGEIGPFSLTAYDEVAGWAEMILEVVQQGRMPPWHAAPEYGRFRNENRLSDQEKELIRQWVEAGAPQGDPAELPEPIQWVEGWQLPREPDLVIPVTPEPFNVPATGEVRYQYFVVDPGFTEDKWIEAAELQPGNRAVVHHILVFARRSPLDADEGGLRGFLVGYVPGLRVEPLPAGMAKRIPAGSKLVFQVHYTPIGTPQKDQSRLGLIFADPKKVTHEVMTTSVVQRRLRIPPRESDYRVEATRAPLSFDCLLLGLMPHMHLRGKSFRYEAIFPDGTREILLDVPRYDFNWQTAYRLEDPKPLPAGTRMHCVAHYDNSERNLNNPDPDRWVTWGDQTWDEMMIGYFDIAVPIAQAMNQRRIAAERARQVVQQFDRNGNAVIDQDEVPPSLQRVFQRLDLNKDGRLTEEELMEFID